jgi:hypothetical protein
MDAVYGFTKYENAERRIKLYLEQKKSQECVKYLKEYICALLDFIGIEYVKYGDKSYCVRLLLIDGRKLSLSVAPDINKFNEYPNLEFQTVFVQVNDKLEFDNHISYSNIYEFGHYLRENISDFKLNY